MKSASLDPGPVIILIVLALLAVPAVAGIDDGPDPIGRAVTEDPSPVAHGLWYTGVLAVPPGAPPAWEAWGGVCSTYESGACAAACDQQVRNPYCCSFSDCESTGNGGVNCHCEYFCARLPGGHTPRPDDVITMQPKTDGDETQ